jgi:hypothetical protein
MRYVEFDTTIWRISQEEHEADMAYCDAVNVITTATAVAREDASYQPRW